MIFGTYVTQARKLMSEQDRQLFDDMTKFEHNFLGPNGWIKCGQWKIYWFRKQDGSVYLQEMHQITFQASERLIDSLHNQQMTREELYTFLRRGIKTEPEMPSYFKFDEREMEWLKKDLDEREFPDIFSVSLVMLLFAHHYISDQIT